MIGLECLEVDFEVSQRGAARLRRRGMTNTEHWKQSANKGQTKKEELQL